MSIIALGPFRLDTRNELLLRATEPVALGRRAIGLLRALVERPGELIPTHALIEAGWPDRVVEEGNLQVQIAALRRVFAETPGGERWIQTMPRRGYRFIGPVVTNAEPGFADPPAPSVVPVAPVSQPAVAPRLSIVVLPFANLSNDREQQYFADGITEDLTTDLSRIAHSFVISRNTAFTYHNKAIESRQIGRELGVRYVLEGSVRRSGNRVRINAQLIDAETDAHLWAERFDHDSSDLFTVQSEITSRLANALGVELIAAEAVRPTEHPDALDYILRGRAVLFKPRTHDMLREAINLFERALALDPKSVDAQTLLAEALVARVTNGLTGSAVADVLRAETLIDTALAASPRNGYAHLVKGRVLRAQYRWEAAIPQYEMALALNRNLVGALHGLAWCKLFAAIDEVIPLEEQAIRLSPRDPDIGYWYLLIGRVHLLQSRTDEAIRWLEKGCSAIPAVSFHHSWLAAAYALKGETERAAAELAETQRLAGDGSFSSIARVKEGGSWRVPQTRAIAETTYFAGLRKAGMPEESGHR